MAPTTSSSHTSSLSPLLIKISAGIISNPFWIPFSFYHSRVTTGLLTSSVMRVFYIIKALQITVAAIVIYRLLSVDELCDVRIIKSISSCHDTVTLFLPRHVSDHQVGTTNSVNSGQQRPQNLDLVSGSIGHHTILTHKDQGLEEVHDRNIKKEKQEEAVSSTNPNSQSPSSPTPHLGHTTNVQDQDGHTDLKTSVKPIDQPTGKVEHDLTAFEAPTAANGTTGVVKNAESSTASVTKNEHKQERSEGLEPVDEVENSTQSLLGEELGAETEELPTGTPVSVADKTNPKEPERKMKFRLKNTVHNCLPIHTADMLGFGSLDLSHSVALRVPIVCMIISMAGTAISVFHAFTNLSRPRKCRSFIENVAQVVLWTLCALTLLLIRQDWNLKWELGTGRSFLPQYPAAWHCAELLCYAVVIVYLAECYFYDYTYYKIYYEETLGNYTVVDRPEYGNSIYTSTVEMTEDTSL
nr:unnamed protein product [Haemonchus contortus]